MSRIAVDVDGVLANLTGPFLDFYNQRNKTNFRLDDISTFDFKEVFSITKKEEGQLFFDFFDLGYFRNLQPIKDSQKTTSYLSRENHLAIITARTEHVKSQTYEWIQKFFPDVFSDIHFAKNIYSTGEPRPTKSEFCLDNKYEIMIEDDLNHANSCAEKGIDAILLNYPWNEEGKTHPAVKRAENWYGILDILK